MFTFYCYIAYLLIGIPVTIWVGQTLFRNGRVFLVDATGGNEQLADSINHLLIVGFYLINIGYIALALRNGEKPKSLEESFEFVSTKIGVVLLVLGGMHFFNLFALSKFRSWGRRLSLNATSV